MRTERRVEFIISMVTILEKGEPFLKNQFATQQRFPAPSRTRFARPAIFPRSRERACIYDECSGDWIFRGARLKTAKRVEKQKERKA